MTTPLGWWPGGGSEAQLVGGPSLRRCCGRPLLSGGLSQQRLADLQHVKRSHVQ